MRKSAAFWSRRKRSTSKGADAWPGANVIVLSGVTIGEGTVVAEDARPIAWGARSDPSKLALPAATRIVAANPKPLMMAL